jgi:hypothetical protein
VLVAMAALVAIAAVGRPRLIRAAEQIDAAVTASEAPRARSAAE